MILLTRFLRKTYRRQHLRWKRASATFQSGPVAVEDPGVGSGRRAIIAKTERHIFVAPDNGILSFVFDGCKEVSVFEVTNTDYFKSPVSSTFHGRDVFAPIAAHLSLGAKPEAFGKKITDW